MRRLVLLLAVVVLSVSSFLIQADTAKAATCTSYSIVAVDEGGGSWNNRNYFLYVYGTTRGDGTVWVLYHGGWIKTHFKAVSLTPDRKGVRFGVSTWWAYNHLGFWKTYRYKYTYPC